MTEKVANINNKSNIINLIEKPFENEFESATIDQLTIENQLDKIQLFGSIEITKDKAGLVLAEQLSHLFEDIIVYLKNRDLPDNINICAEKKECLIDNPFN